MIMTGGKHKEKTKNCNFPEKSSLKKYTTSKTRILLTKVIYSVRKGFESQKIWSK